MPIYALDGVSPEFPEDGDYWVAETAVLIGRVRLRKGASVWFGAVLRGDNEWIEVDEGSNVQDGAVLHTDMGFPCTIGRDCTIGHQAMLHGCTIGDGALVGMGATVLNGAVIGPGSLVGAHALVGEGKSFDGGQLIIGMPAKAVRALDADAMARMRGGSAGYVANARRYAKGLTRVG